MTIRKSYKRPQRLGRMLIIDPGQSATQLHYLTKPQSYDRIAEILSEGHKQPHHTCVELLMTKDDRQLLIDEEGKLKQLPVNTLATLLAIEVGAIAPDDHIVGRAIILEGIARLR